MCPFSGQIFGPISGTARARQSTSKGGCHAQEQTSLSQLQSGPRRERERSVAETPADVPHRARPPVPSLHLLRHASAIRYCLSCRSSKRVQRHVRAAEAVACTIG